MRSIDFIYRYDPDEPVGEDRPKDSQEARALLMEGNQLFSQWISQCVSKGGMNTAQYVVQCNPLELGLTAEEGQAVEQAPFAVLLGCADARVPAEMIFGQARNNLFVIRVAGNVLSDECIGSVEYAMHHLDSIRIILVLGHTACGAVTAAVDTYLNPWDYLGKIPSHTLRSIVDRIFAPVHKAAGALESIWGPNASSVSGYREALIETSVFVNAAQAAYDLQTMIMDSGKTEIEVVYGVLDLVTQQVESAEDSLTPGVRLATAPQNLGEFEELSLKFAIHTARKSATKALTSKAPP